MLRLYLVRHGIAVDPEDPECPPEPERFLTEKGIRKTREAAKGLRTLGVNPDRLLSSPYTRARQTADIFAAEFGCKAPVETTEALLPDRPPAELFEDLLTMRRGEVMAFGHAPHLDEALAHALGLNYAVTAMKKAAVACLELDAISPPQGFLIWYLPPAILRQLG